MKTATRYITTAILLALSLCAFADNDPEFFIGYGQSSWSAEHETNDSTSYVAGLEMRQATSVEVEHADTQILGNDSSQDTLRMICSFIDLGNHSITWQAGWSHAEVDIVGENISDNYISYGLGYQWRILNRLSLRAMYNVYEVDEFDNVVDMGSPEEISVSLIARF